ncbi:S-layer homology domain-containing protein [Nitriliruptoraceae bacterium ZYF776]|nr:S-layer homology domain-containing protein [Profundirhabdus halotolerans]
MASFVRRTLSYLDDGEVGNASAPPAASRDAFPDDDGSVHEPHIDAIAAAGIVQGFADSTFRPSDPVRRDQAATFLVRSIDYALVELTDPPIDPGPEPTDGVCEVLDEAACLLPFPSDRFTVAADTPTGRQVALPAEGMPVSEGLPIPISEDVTLPAIGETAIDPTEWNRNDGFSPGTPILVHVPGVDLQETFGLDAGVQVVDRPAVSLAADAPIVLLDADTGERVPYLVELDHHPDAVEAGTQLLVVRPLVHLTPGHRVVVGLRELRAADGTVLPAAEAFAWYRDRPSGTPGADEGSRVAEVERTLADLGDAGVARDTLYLAWDFTVASSEGLTGRALSIRDRAFAALGDTDLGDRELDGGAPAVVVTGMQTDGLPADTARRIEARVQVPKLPAPRGRGPDPGGRDARDVGARVAARPDHRPVRLRRRGPGPGRRAVAGGHGRVGAVHLQRAGDGERRRSVGAAALRPRAARHQA